MISLHLQKKILKYLERIGIALSVLINVLFGGHSNQTFSARNWKWKLDNKPNIVWFIDFIFLHFKSEEMHCKKSWEFWAYRIKKHGETRYERRKNIR